MEYTFKVVIEECEEGGYYAECPAFEDCVLTGRYEVLFFGPAHLLPLSVPRF